MINSGTLTSVSPTAAAAHRHPAERPRPAVQVTEIGGDFVGHASSAHLAPFRQTRYCLKILLALI
jgi:hypothetical protein